jgi:hypothetical protein
MVSGAGACLIAELETDHPLLHKQDGRVDCRSSVAGPETSGAVFLS